MADELHRLVSDLQLPTAYDHPVDSVEVLQTHISYVLLAGEYAYKIKKPVDLGFLDYSTLEQRRHMCEEEVRLNRRLCDGVYLGVERVTRREDGTYHFGGAADAVEYAVRMRRVRAEHEMPQLLSTGQLTRDNLAALAAKLAAFHRDADVDDRIAAFGRVPAVRSNWDENFQQTTPFVGGTITLEQLNRMRGYVTRFLEDEGQLIEERAANGRVRDGHGDLRADSVVFSGGSVCVMDCIEFSDRLRCCDVASDAAFLAMDLEFRGHRREADEFVSLYMESLVPDETLPVVLNFYRTYRAFVRGKVDSMLSAETEVPALHRAEAAARAKRYFGLAEAYVDRSFPRVVTMMVGLSGTGKSFVARALAGRVGAALVSTDMIRRELAPRGSLEPAAYAAGPYTPEQREATYGEMIDRARKHLTSNRPVVLDATFLTRRLREMAMRLAAEANAPLVIVRIDAPEDVVRARLAGRNIGGTSDARWDTFLAQRERFEPLEDVDPARLITLNSTLPLDALVDEVVMTLRTIARSGHSARPPRS